MGGPDSFEVQVQGHGIYFGGQTIQGQVYINLSEAMSNVKNVQVMLKGFGKVHWKVKKTGKNQSGYRHYRNHEEYVNDNICVHDGDEI